ncbi:hypothetical protein D9601_15400 [Sphingomonas sp. MA1305]|uniref:hypothetical protein n=1 Tax=unclassified Sphingomonas TaxID=196159 RepID=UPI0018E00660|nr:hypothetical protein [Sphingomonas sp. MA1305]MBI0476735.1 hypothetical protein [Sphingomonas sp. MA1305]
MTRTAFARPALFAAAIALAAGASAPAFARSKAPATITMTAKMMDNKEGRLCMPKTTLGSKATKDMPQTLCQTRADWEAQGVTFVVK